MIEQEKIEKLAKGIMGWYLRSFTGCYPTLYRPIPDGEEKVIGWNPFKSWNDAGMIVDELARRQFYLSLSYENELWVFELLTPEEYKLEREYGEQGKTAQEAICETALKILGVKDED